MTESQAIKIIEDYTHEKVIDVNPIINRGQVNQIYFLKTAKEKYILRTDLSEDTTNRFQKEMWCAEVANDQGVFSPKVFTIGLEGGHPYMIMSYVEGKNGDESTEDEKDKIWKELGKYARKIHSIPVKGYGEGMTAHGVFKDSWSRYVNYNISSLTPDDKVIELEVITEKESEKMKNIFLELLNTNFNFGLIHYDLSLKNTILTTKGEVCLIDWGSAKSAPVPHLDIAEILDSSLDENSKQFALFLEGYGLTFQEYEKIKPEMAKVNLLIHTDKLRWAIDRKKEKIGHFSQEVKDKLTKV
jgi:aminoglycoside phosphotransferase (APT) family kinase protein